MLLGSITPGAPIPECWSDASGSQVTPGTGRRFHLGLGQHYRCCLSRDTQAIMRYPSRHLTQSSRRGCSGHHGWGSLHCLERKPPKQLPLPREQPAGLPHSLATLSQNTPQHRATLPSCPLACLQHQVRERQEDLDPATRKGHFWALISRECRNPGFFHHLRWALVTGDRRWCFIVFKSPSDSWKDHHSVVPNEWRRESWASPQSCLDTNNWEKLQGRCRWFYLCLLGNCLNH